MSIVHANSEDRLEPHLCYPVTEKEINLGVTNFEPDFDAADEALAEGAFEDPRILNASDICKRCIQLSDCRSDAIELSEGRSPQTINVGVDNLPTFIGGFIVFEESGRRFNIDTFENNGQPAIEVDEVLPETASSKIAIVERRGYTFTDEEPDTAVESPGYKMQVLPTPDKDLRVAGNVETGSESERSEAAKARTRRFTPEEMNMVRERLQKYNSKWLADIEGGSMDVSSLSWLSEYTICILSVLCRAEGAEFSLGRLKEECDRIAGITLPQSIFVEAISGVVAATSTHTELRNRLIFRTLVGSDGIKTPVLRWKKPVFLHRKLTVHIG